MTHYETLGIRHGAHPAEIDLAYKTLISGTVELSDTDLIELEVAHKTLIHPSRRADYDRESAQESAKPQVQQQQMQAQQQMQVPNFNQENYAITHHYYHNANGYTNSQQSPLSGFLYAYVISSVIVSVLTALAFLF